MILGEGGRKEENPGETLGKSQGSPGGIACLEVQPIVPFGTFVGISALAKRVVILSHVDIVVRLCSRTRSELNHLNLSNSIDCIQYSHVSLPCYSPRPQNIPGMIAGKILLPKIVLRYVLA